MKNEQVNEPQNSLACTECPHVFTAAEIVAEDKNTWGHPCPEDEVPGMHCESFRKPVADSSTVTTESGKTDRELDVLVARRVMGWQHVKFAHGAVFFHSPETLAGSYFQDLGFEVVTSGGEDNAPHYSSRIASAMEVWDKLVADSWLPHLLTMVDGYVVNLHHRDTYDMIQVSADTREEAICLAGLEAAATLEQAAETIQG